MLTKYVPLFSKRTINQHVHEALCIFVFIPLSTPVCSGVSFSTLRAVVYPSCVLVDGSAYGSIHPSVCLSFSSESIYLIIHLYIAI